MMQRLQRAANKFVRLIFKLDLRESVKDSMQQLGILTINQLAELETANFMYKYLHNKLPIVFNGLLDKNTISEYEKPIKAISPIPTHGVNQAINEI